MTMTVNATSRSRMRFVAFLKVSLLCLLVNAAKTWALDWNECGKYQCGRNRVQICHFNGLEFQTLCLRRNSPLRKPQNHHLATETDYCGPCSTQQHKAFETTEELRQAVARYINEEHMDVSLATTYGWPMNQWDVSAIQDFSDLFAHKETLQGESLDAWDVSHATDLSRMFWQCSNFTGSVQSWNTARVQSLERTFAGASKFNGDISHWNTGQVTNMMGTFWQATSFNSDIRHWNTSNVLDMSRMFAHATAFDQPLTHWHTTKVLDTSYQFLHATSFAHDLTAWDLTHVVSMERMLYGVPAYEYSLSKQEELWQNWLHQWDLAGRSVQGIETQEIFSLPSSLPTHPQEVAATFYMRGNTLLHRQHALPTSAAPSSPSSSSIVSATVSTSSPSTSNDTQSQHLLPPDATIETVKELQSVSASGRGLLQEKCISGVCSNPQR